MCSSSKPSDIGPAIIVSPIAARHPQPGLQKVKRILSLFTFTLLIRTGFRSEESTFISFSLGAYSAPYRVKPAFPAFGSSFRDQNSGTQICRSPPYFPDIPTDKLAAASRHPASLLIIRSKSCVAPERVTWGLSDSRQADFGDLEGSTCCTRPTQGNVRPNHTLDLTSRGCTYQVTIRPISVSDLLIKTRHVTHTHLG